VAVTPPIQSDAGRALATQRPWRDLLITKKFFIGMSVLLGASVAFYFLASSSRQNQPDVVVVRSLAILPFKPTDAQAGDEQLGLGMADAILTKLSKLPVVRVLPTTAVFKYSGRERDPIACGRELGVDAVLDGTMQRSDGRIRVTAQLIRVSDGRTLWADQFDEPLAGLLALQDSVSEQVARAVAPQIRVVQDKPTKRYSENLAAYESFLMGFFFWNKRGKDDLVKAIPYLQQAVKQDPNFALAHAILADCHLMDAYYGYNIYPAKESYERAQAEASKALALDQSIAESHIVMAGIKSGIEGDSAAAQAEYKLGLELNANYATGRIRYGFELFYSLRLDEAVRQVRLAQELDPLSPATNSALSFMLIMARNYDDAIKFGRRALELNARLTVARVNLGEAYLRKGMYREAFDEFGQVSEDDPLRAQQCLAHAYAWAGEQDKARALLSQLKRSPNAGRLSALDIAAVHTALGETEAALMILKSAALDMEALALLSFDSQWDTLRSDQRFEALIRRGKQQ
jgi:TolB-like protein/lipoprotein NlpI